MLIVNNSFKESFCGEKNVLTIFFVFNKSDVKTFIK